MSDYWNTVEAIAEEAREEYPDPNDEGRHRYIHESVDGSSWIIYTANHETVLRESDNEPDPKEVKAMSAEDADWQDMRMLAAFLAMEADVWEKLRELDEEAEEEEEEEEEDEEETPSRKRWDPFKEGGEESSEEEGEEEGEESGEEEEDEGEEEPEEEDEDFGDEEDKEDE
jgi:hypothetical protein